MENKLNIAFDTTFFLNVALNISKRSGVFYYAYNLVEIIKERKDINLFFFTKKKNNNILKKFFKDILCGYDCKIINENSKEWYYINIYYSPYDKIPNFIREMSNIQLYTTVHDIIVILFKDYYNESLFNRFNKILNSFTTKDYILNVSEYTKKDFIKYMGDKIDSKKVFVHYLGCKEHLKPRAFNINILNKYDIPIDKKYALSLCNLEPRKNIYRIIRTFSNFLEKNKINDMILVIAGDKFDKLYDVFIENIKPYMNNIKLIGYVNDEDLSYLYSASQWFIYTSEYEGFGLPPLESMACGCPVITSNNSSLPEVIGDSGIMIDFDSDEQHIKAYEQYYFDDEYRKKMSIKGLEHSKKFTWKKCADKMIDIMYKNLDNSIKKCYVLCEDVIHFKLFKNIITLPRLINILGVRESEDQKFNIVCILGFKISIKKK